MRRDRSVWFVSLATASSLLGDQMLYAVLPTMYADLGPRPIEPPELHISVGAAVGQHTGGCHRKLRLPGGGHTGVREPAEGGRIAHQRRAVWIEASRHERAVLGVEEPARGVLGSGMDSLDQARLFAAE